MMYDSSGNPRHLPSIDVIKARLNQDSDGLGGTLQPIIQNSDSLEGLS